MEMAARIVDSEAEPRWTRAATDRDSVRRVPREAERPAAIQATSETGNLGDQVALSLFVFGIFLAQVADLTYASTTR